MNTKIEFKGSVNGTEYDNVKAYNEALSKAIKEGNLSNASSSTRVVSCSDNLLMTPGFNPARICSSYLNNEDDSEENLEDIFKKIDGFSEDELDDYHCVLTEIQDQIDADKSRLEEEKEKCEKKIEQIEKKLKCNNKYAKVYNAIDDKCYAKLEHLNKESNAKSEDNKKETGVEKKKPVSIWEQLWEDLFEPF